MDNNSNILFSPFNMAGTILKNRLVMAPLTRNRALPVTDAPHSLNAIYYAQRAKDAGLIIAEASQISPSAKGYAWTPGIYSHAQIEGWKLVTKAVHENQGLIYLQLWHVGRVSHPSLLPHNMKPLAPSAIVPKNTSTFIENGTFVNVGTPQELTTEEIKTIVNDYRQAAANAIEAGFDGVEIHAANGYLIQQFLSDGVNQRHDNYGGSITNRLRFAIEVVEAVTNEIGSYRTGIRISPVTTSNDCLDSDPAKIYGPLIDNLNKFNLAYIHVVEGVTGGAREFNGFDFHALRAMFKGPWMVNNGYDYKKAVAALTSGYADLIAFGKLYLANPDLAARFKNNLKLNTPDKSTFYGGDEKGYTDYPFLMPEKS